MCILLRAKKVEPCVNWAVPMDSVFSHTLQNIDNSVSVLTDEVYFKCEFDVKIQLLFL